MDQKFKVYGLDVLNKLRNNNIEVHFDYKYNLKKSLSDANQNKFEYVVIIGENEAKNDLCTFKNLNKNSQESISIDELIKILT